MTWWRMCFSLLAIVFATILLMTLFKLIGLKSDTLKGFVTLGIRAVCVWFKGAKEPLSFKM